MVRLSENSRQHVATVTLFNLRYTSRSIEGSPVACDPSSSFERMVTARSKYLLEWLLARGLGPFQLGPTLALSESGHQAIWTTNVQTSLFYRPHLGDFP